ncbi:MAG TPA: phospho-N-acetylmuramoyl-pentapeptide-transferase [Verrucomicrobia bacterium]|jgi:phospho-N-acetylmuramoyl-pentapeptide-transferase|nr:phospho-N-acetylmuramoyl-pentapeptide-transferase [Verrucomicrobiota bacterium]
MLYYLQNYTDFWSPLRVFKFITFRSGGAFLTAFLMVCLLAPGVIRFLRMKNIAGSDRAIAADLKIDQRKPKNGTPTMGGILILAAVVVATLLWAQVTNVLVLAVLLVFIILAALGAVDDWHKVTGKHKGIHGRTKLIVQWSVGAAVGWYLCYVSQNADTLRGLYVPFMKVPVVADMGLLSVLFFGFVLVGTSNAVNLTDGMDGLAIGCTISSSLAYLIFAYIAGNAIFSDYLQVPHVSGSGELAIPCAALAGAGMGFLWFNCNPATVFMGDTGSLAIGGMIGAVACIIRQELVLVIVGGVFVIEAVSVIIQVTYFKWTKKRFFLCTPIHHHFELMGWTETQITVRFWILSALFALIGLGTLKLR